MSTLRHKYKLENLLATAKLPRATYYYQVKPFAASDKYAALAAEIEAVYAERTRIVSAVAELPWGCIGGDLGSTQSCPAPDVPAIASSAACA
ncbi:MAG: hypothetical protein RSC55_08530 [Oscillospiraceae bacterium]